MDDCGSLGDLMWIRDYNELPKASGVYVCRIGNGWYVGSSQNICSRARMRKSRLKVGKCNERLIQDEFKRCNKYPDYQVLELTTDLCTREAYWFKQVAKRYEDYVCLNILHAGSNVSSHVSQREVYARIAESLRRRAKTKEGKAHLRALGKKAGERNAVPVKVGKVVYASKFEAADKLGYPRGSIGRLVSRGVLPDGRQIKLV